MKRIEPLNEGYKIENWTDVLVDKINELISAHNEAVEPKETLVDTPDQSAKYRVALEKILTFPKEIEKEPFQNAFKRLNEMVDIAKSALNPNETKTLDKSLEPKHCQRYDEKGKSRPSTLHEILCIDLNISDCELVENILKEIEKRLPNGYDGDYDPKKLNEYYDGWEDCLKDIKERLK